VNVVSRCSCGQCHLRLAVRPLARKVVRRRCSDHGGHPSSGLLVKRQTRTHQKSKPVLRKKVRNAAHRCGPACWQNRAVCRSVASMHESEALDCPFRSLTHHVSEQEGGCQSYSHWWNECCLRPRFFQFPANLRSGRESRAAYDVTWVSFAAPETVDELVSRERQASSDSSVLSARRLTWKAYWTPSRSRMLSMIAFARSWRACYRFYPTPMSMGCPSHVCVSSNYQTLLRVR